MKKKILWILLAIAPMFWALLGIFLNKVIGDKYTDALITGCSFSAITTIIALATILGHDKNLNPND